MKILFALMTIFAMVLIVRAELDKSVCSLPKDVGPCRGAGRSFFFNGKECELFLYGGCMGNDNRFGTQEDCEKVCT